MTISPPARRLRNILLLAAAAASWGFGTVVSKQAVAELPALTLLVIQLAVSVLVMAAVVRLRGEPMPRTREGRLLGRLGLLNPGLAYALSLIGLTGITASLAVLLWATEPILILVLAAVVLGERVGGPVIASSAVAVAGLVLVVADPGSTGGSAEGIALTIAGVVVCALYTVLTRRWILGTDATFPVVLSQQAHALGLIAVVTALAAVAGQTILPSSVSAAGVASAIVSGLLYYALAYSCYLTALREVRAPIAAAAFYLIPVFGIAGAWVTDERLAAGQWLGAAITIAAVVVITTRTAERPQPSSAAASTQMPMTPSASSRR